MCLEIKARFKPCKMGYKVVIQRNNGDLASELQGNFMPFRKGIWLNEDDFRELSLKHKKMIYGSHFSVKQFNYPFGWHIFNKLSDAKDCWRSRAVVVKVAVKNPVAVGYQGTSRITVAKQIKILELLSYEHQTVSREAAA